ncbi:hypothetical protein H5410_031441 [Solanum commersonii]|uniref:Uncharacterized protein n=1 Tax=Solanum commersonii TaxID=4109 RepID=A0A9J5YJX9_SOLCO|nr:hypothetical protein H5410_031441 [Solanum commersonii]
MTPTSATECAKGQGDRINSIKLDLHRRLMVGAAFLGKKDSGKRMLIKNRHLVSAPSAVATTLLH